MNEPDTKNDLRSTADLINVVLGSNEEDAAYWQAMHELHRRGTSDVFAASRSLCESPCSLEQKVGCNILSQLGCSERPFAAVSFPLVAHVLQTTEDRDTLASALNALGWLRDLRGVELVLSYGDHVDADVRLWATLALTSLEVDPRSIDGLIRLTTDPSVEVRDWATFGLGSQTDQDTPAIRQALMARLDDPDDTVRGEALVGLAVRQDRRVVEPLRQALEAGTYSKSCNDFAAEALNALNNLEEYPQLLKWKRA